MALYLSHLVCVLFPALLLAQQPTVENLTFQFVARDERHRPVTDLKAEEIQITEEGKAVVLTDLKANPGPRSLSILVDSGSSESLALLRDATPDLRSALKADVQIALWDTRQVALLHDFSADRSFLIGSHEKECSGSLNATVFCSDRATTLNTSQTPKPADTSAVSQAILTTAHRLVDTEHRSAVFALLFALIEQQGETPGRKEILFFAPGDEDSSLTDEQTAALGSNALRAGASIYIIEAGGAGAQVEAKAAAILSPKGRSADKTSRAAGPQNKSRDLAHKSGGAYAVAGKDSGREVTHRTAEDFNAYYQATYTPPSPPGEDGRFRPIVVKTSRPHIAIQDGAGYFSVPALDTYATADWEPRLLQSLHNDSDNGNLLFDAAVLRFGQQNSKTNVDLIVEVPRSSLTTLSNDSEKLLKVHFAVYAVIRSADGAVVSRFNQDVPFETAIEHAAASPKNLFTVNHMLPLPPGDYRAEFAAVDENSAAVGKRTVTFSIAKPESTLTLGDIIVIRGVEPRDKFDDGPLAFGPQSLVPWASAAIRGHKGAELPVLLKIYADPSAPAMPDVQLEVRRDADVVANLPLMVSGGTNGQFQALVWLPEDSLDAGHYTLIAHAVLSQTATEGHKEFDYAPPPAGASETTEADSSPDLAPKQLLTAGPALIAGAKRPSDNEIADILHSARERALDYKKTLPNFSCLESMKRFISKSGVQNWKAKDTITELLRYSDGKEQHQILEVNGVTKAGDRSEVKGLMTKGEFGEFLDSVYSPDAHAEFAWQGRTIVDGQEAHVFSYKVKRANSIYSMSTVDGLSRVVSAFHGVIHIDANTLVTRFVSIEAEDIPTQAMYRESNLSVNYGYFVIEGQKFLLPKTAVLSVRIGKRFLSKDEMQFRNYRRFGATSTLILR